MPRSIDRNPRASGGIGAQYDGSVHACVRSDRVAASRRFARRPHGLRWPATVTLASTRPRLLVDARKRCHRRHDIDMGSKRFHIPISCHGSGTLGCPVAPRLVPRSTARAPRVHDESCFQDHPDLRGGVIPLPRSTLGFLSDVLPRLRSSPRVLEFKGYSPERACFSATVFTPSTGLHTSHGCSRPPGIDRADLAADFAAAPLTLLPYRTGRCWSLRVSIGRPARSSAPCGAGHFSPSGFFPFCRDRCHVIADVWRASRLVSRCYRPDTLLRPSAPFASPGVRSALPPRRYPLRQVRCARLREPCGSGALRSWLSGHW